MKKILSAVLASAMALTCISTAFAKTFSDFSEKKYPWAYDQVTNMVKKGYITGYDDNTFRPDNSVTRLEVLALFSRALGALDESNAEILNLAVDKYAATLKPISLPWGEKEISFLLYRDVLTPEDLNTYLKDKLKNEAMPRYEAAVIITKAMGGKKEATSTQAVNLDYSDLDKIPASAVQYVKFVTDNGIMTGMDGGAFSPDTSVLRSQMAVMLDRVVNKTNYEFKSGKLMSVDTNARNVTVADSDGEQATYAYTDNVVMKITGEEVAPKSMISGVNAIFTLTDNKVAFIDTLTTVADEKYTGTFQSRATISGKTRITIKKNDDGRNYSYDLSDSVSVSYDGEPSSLTNFKVNDLITIELQGGKVEKIVGEPMSTTITNAIIEEVSIDPELKVTISHSKSEYDGMSFEVDEDAVVIKNNDNSDLSKIYVGDRAILTLTYGKISAINATSSTKSKEGSIKEITISNEPKIKVRINGEDEVFNVAKGVTIKVNGEEGSLYDFRVGDSVKLTLESDTVTKIETTTAKSASGKIEGTVTAVNTAYGFIKIVYTDEYSSLLEETIYCKDAGTTIMDASGATKKMKDLKEGQNVTIHGTSSNGAFTAKIIIISAE